MLKFAKNIFKYNFSQVRSFSSHKEILDYRKYEEFPQLTQKITKCLVLHPILYPNKGPMKELYLAEEAVGLVKALDWNVAKGPFWKEPENNPMIEDNSQEEEAEEKSTSTSGRNVKRTTDLRKAREGDYVVTPFIKGEYAKGGVFVDFTSDEEDDDGDMYHEWKNKILRESFAKSSLVKVRNASTSTYFGSGKVIELGKFLKENDVDAVFVNSELTSLHVRNLEKKWSNIINGKDEDVEEEPDYIDEREFLESTIQAERRIRVFDRFTIILQIFAKRAKTRVARLQIELAFLTFLKTKLMREADTFIGMYNIFEGDLMSAKEIKTQIVSSKQRGALGKLAGEGESQLEIERRLINDKQAKIRRDLLTENENRQRQRIKRKESLQSLPTIALIGYTNAGKSALMNKLTRANVESEDKLFQTLSTTSKKIKLPSGQLGLVLDTIGFITNLPHDLIESFKCTLEEVQDADIVLHIRDISHPNTEDQKKVVLDVLQELGFDEGFYTKRMIEVWNKIDLLETPLNYKEVMKSNVSVVPISALHGTNSEMLMEKMSDKINEVMGKRYYKFEHSPEDHSQKLNWIFKNGNVSETKRFYYDDRPSEGFPYGKITFEVLLDDVTYRRYQATFGGVEGKRLRDKIPDDWVKNSKSFFERRAEERQKQRMKEAEQKKAQIPGKKDK